MEAIVNEELVNTMLCLTRVVVLMGVEDRLLSAGVALWADRAECPIGDEGVDGLGKDVGLGTDICRTGLADLHFKLTDGGCDTLVKDSDSTISGKFDPLGGVSWGLRGTGGGYLYK